MVIKDFDRSVQRISSYFEGQKGKVTIGIDGYIDEVWNMVKRTNGSAHFEFYQKVEDFANVLRGVGAGGIGIECVRKRRSCGGFTANTGRAIGRLGVDVIHIAMYGKDQIDPVFQEFGKKCKIISIGAPAVSQNYEFKDGKIMLSSSQEIMNLDWERLTSSLSNEVLSNVYGDADIIGFGYWSNMMAFDDMVAKICENFIIPGKSGKTTRMFFDFADLRKRGKHDLMHTLGVLGVLNKKVPMTLSLNEHEAGILFNLMSKDFDWRMPSESVEVDIEFVRSKIELDELIVHTPYFAVGATATEGVATVLQNYCEDPVATTGAGDNFNGGYIAASVSYGELSLSERLLVGNATTGFYIRYGYPPTADEVIKEIKGG